MTNEEIQTVVVEELRRVAPEIDPARLDPDEKVRDALDIDSFDALRVIIALNDRLGVEIPEKDYGELNTLNEITNYLSGLVT